MRERARTYRVVGCFVLGLLISTVGWADSDCSANARAKLARENVENDFTDLQFDVEVSTGERCAKIVYDLIIEEQLPNGQSKRIRIPRVVKLDDGGLQEMVLHRLSSGHRMLEYEAKIHTCQTCDLMP